MWNYEKVRLCLTRIVIVVMFVLLIYVIVNPSSSTLGVSEAEAADIHDYVYWSMFALFLMLILCCLGCEDPRGLGVAESEVDLERFYAKHSM